MPTKFGKFVTAKLFSKLFLLFYTAFVCFAAYETNWALCLLTGRTHLFGIVYIVFALLGILIATKKNISAKWCNRFHKKTMSFLSCLFIYYFGILLLCELILIVSDFSDRVKAIGVLASIGIAIIVVLLGYLHTKVIKIKKYNISLNEGNDRYRIAMMSDIHLGVFVDEKHVQKIVKTTNSLSPDLVVISGDIFDVDNSLLNDAERLKRISKLLRKIKSKDGVYAILGNHDPKTDNKTFLHFLKASKIELLDNEVKVLSKLNIVGRTDENAGERKNFDEIASSIDFEKPIVVLDHKPQEIDDAAKNGVDLVLCGHTHRGQLFPVTIFTKWANGKKYFYGHRLFGKTHGIITSGVGFFELPMRIGTSNEIVDIQLVL